MRWFAQVHLANWSLAWTTPSPGPGRRETVVPDSPWNPTLPLSISSRRASPLGWRASEAGAVPIEMKMRCQNSNCEPWWQSPRQGTHAPSLGREVSSSAWLCHLQCDLSKSPGHSILSSEMRIIVATLWMLCAVRSHFSCVRLSATLWTIAHQAPLTTGFSRQEYWSGLPCPSPVDLPNPGIEIASLISPALAGWLFTTSTTWETLWMLHEYPINHFYQILSTCEMLATVNKKF